MAIPSPTLPAPVLSDWQMSFGGLVFGGVDPNGAYHLQTLATDMPDVASGDIERALDHGEFIGLDKLPGADITIAQAVRADDVSLDHAVQALGGAFGPGGSIESPLWLKLPTGTFCRLARARKHSCPIDINRVLAGGTVATTLLHCTDPRWYAAPTVSQTVALPPSAGGGLAIPASFPAVFGSGGAVASVNVVNSGRFETRPVLVITGPCINPVIANATLPGSPFIGVSVTLLAGDTLTIDTDWQSVVLRSAGTSFGASRRGALMPEVTWWNLPANSASTITFSSSDPAPAAGTLTVISASGYLSL